MVDVPKIPPAPGDDIRRLVRVHRTPDGSVTVRTNIKGDLFWWSITTKDRQRFASTYPLPRLAIAFACGLRALETAGGNYQP